MQLLLLRPRRGGGFWVLGGEKGGEGGEGRRKGIERGEGGDI